MHNDKNTTTPETTVAELQKKIRTLERSTTISKIAVSSTGCEALDALFPVHGIRHGSLVEWIGAQEGNGSGTLSLLTAWCLCQSGGSLVVVDSRKHVSAQALVAFGVDLSRVVIVRPESDREVLWACEESLRCKGDQIVWAEIGNIAAISFRRLQLATEASGRVGFLVRPKEAMRQPSWAEVRLLVSSRLTGTESPGFRVKVVYCRGKTAGTEIDIMIDSCSGTIYESSTTTNPVSLVS